MWFARMAGRAPEMTEPFFRIDDERLSQEVFGLTFRNPVGLAPGFDKNAVNLAAWQALGFGFCEVGSVTARPAEGNPRPRAFRLTDDRALVNRMGLNNDGADAVAERLESHEPVAGFPVGVNVAKTHDPDILGDAALEDFALSVERLAPHADYLALNVSCPNTAEGKTFEDPRALEALLERVMPIVEPESTRVPILVKFSPPGVAPGGLMDFGQLGELVSICLDRGVSGFIATNTASDRVNLATDPVRLGRIGGGGLSGRPLAQRALAMVHQLRSLTEGRVPVIAVGGIDSAEEAYERVLAGASLVQTYTGLVYEGPGLVRRINDGLLRLLERDGYDRLSDAVGAHHNS